MKIVSKSQFARMAGVTPSAITKACKGPIKSAMVGKRIDASHSVAAIYVANKAAARAPTVELSIESLCDVDMTLRELIERRGTETRFANWLRALKTIEDINEKRLRNTQTKGELVSREAVKIGVVDPINAAHIKLLADGTKTIARRVAAMHGAGRSLDDIEVFVKNQITSFIRSVKTKAARI